LTPLWYTGLMEEGLKQKSKLPYLFLALVLIFACAAVVFQFRKKDSYTPSDATHVATGQVESAGVEASLVLPELDKRAYEEKLKLIANAGSPTSTAASLWPVKAAYPKANPILPFNRIVAYYGNLYSRGMGILGEYREDEVLRRLSVEVEKWNTADPQTPVTPALHYIAVVAQAGPGRDGKYRARMPDKEIDKVLAMAEKANAIVFLDVQAGLSNVESEIPRLEKYLQLPNVHLGIDPEFYMKTGARPGTRIGSMDAREINYAIHYLSNLVKENNLPPKVLVIHRFTRPMVTNSEDIVPTPEVQVVINMDGFGSRGAKKSTYASFIYSEPVQFTGFKVFYKNDSAADALLSPVDILKLTPIPSYIQYQ
jgi:hypothetical protein